MSISKGSSMFGSIFHGSTGIAQVYSGSDLVFPSHKYGEYLGTNWCAGITADGNNTVYNFSIRFEKGSIPGSVAENGTVTFSEERFEEGTDVWAGASYIGSGASSGAGELVNCNTSTDSQFGLLWYRGTNTVIQMKSFTDLTRMGYNHGSNVFTPSRYGVMNYANGVFSIPGTSWTWNY